MKIINKKIYFNLRPHSRERMWDTTKYASKFCEVLLPNVKQQTSINVYQKLQPDKLIPKLKNKVGQYLINKQAIDYSAAKKRIYSIYGEHFQNLWMRILLLK